MTTESKQIFIVDDDESVCRALSVVLGTYGFTVDTFTSAESFFGTVPNSALGCLILDIHMPGLGGWEAIDQLHASGCSRPVIIISADKQNGLNEKAAKAGSVGFLQKPFDAGKLVDLVKAGYVK